MAAKSTSISRWCPWFWIGFAFHWFPLKLVGTKNCEHLSILVIRSSLLESTAHGEAGWGWHGVQRQGSWSFSCNESFNELQWAAMGTHMLKIYLILIWSHISKQTHTNPCASLSHFQKFKAAETCRKFKATKATHGPGHFWSIGVRGGPGRHGKLCTKPSDNRWLNRRSMLPCLLLNS